jgi:hypothetical protein
MILIAVAPWHVQREKAFVDPVAGIDAIAIARGST